MARLKAFFLISLLLFARGETKITRGELKEPSSLPSKTPTLSSTTTWSPVNSTLAANLNSPSLAPSISPTTATHINKEINESRLSYPTSQPTLQPTSQPTLQPSLPVVNSSVGINGTSYYGDDEYYSKLTNYTDGGNISSNGTSNLRPTPSPTLTLLPFLFNATCPEYAVRNTSSATKHYESCFFSACEGDYLQISGCGDKSYACPRNQSVPICSKKNDQFLRLAAEYGRDSGLFYALSSGDDCKSYCHCSIMSYKVPIDGFGCRKFEIIEGCYDSSSCYGKVEVFSTADIRLLINVTVISTKFTNFTLPTYTEQPTSQPTTFIPTDTKYRKMTVQAATAMSGVRAATVHTSTGIAALKTAIVSLLNGRVKTSDIDIISIENKKSNLQYGQNDVKQRSAPAAAVVAVVTEPSLSSAVANAAATHRARKLGIAEDGKEMSILSDQSIGTTVTNSEEKKNEGEEGVGGEEGTGGTMTHSMSVTIDTASASVTRRSSSFSWFHKFWLGDAGSSLASNGTSGTTSSGTAPSGSSSGDDIGIIIHWNVSIVVERYLQASSVSATTNSSVLATLLNHTLTTNTWAGNFTSILQTICPEVFENVTVQTLRVESYSVVVVSPPTAEPTYAPTEAPSRSILLISKLPLDGSSSRESLALKIGVGVAVGVSVLISTLCVYYYCTKREDSSCARAGSDPDEVGQVYYVHDIGMTAEDRHRQAVATATTTSAVFVPALAVVTSSRSSANRGHSRTLLGVPLAEAEAEEPGEEDGEGGGEGVGTEKLVWATAPAIAVCITDAPPQSHSNSTRHSHHQHYRRRSLTHPTGRSSSPSRLVLPPRVTVTGTSTGTGTSASAAAVAPRPKIRTRSNASAAIPSNKSTAGCRVLRPSAPIPSDSPQRPLYSDRRHSGSSISNGGLGSMFGVGVGVGMGQQQQRNPPSPLLTPQPEDTNNNPLDMSSSGQGPTALL